MVEKNLHQALDRLHTLPAIPKVAREILALKIITDEGEEALLKLIEKDPPISAKIVGLANSPLFGASKKILSVHDASALLGIRRIKMTALSFAMMSSLARHPAGLLNVQELWQHCLAVTMAMSTIARHMPKALRPDDEELFLAGLLHDIGFLVLDHVDPALSDKFHAYLPSASGRPIEEIEAEMLEMSHCELGAELGRHWGLQEPIVAVLQYHHQPDKARGTAYYPIVKMANLAEKLLPTFCMPEQIDETITPEEWQSLGIDEAGAEEIVVLMQQHMTDAAGMMG